MGILNEKESGYFDRVWSFIPSNVDLSPFCYYI